VEETVSTDAEVEIGPGRWDMTVLWLKPEQLVPNVANPNQQDDATFNALVRSIRQDGWSQVVTAVAIGEVTGGPEDRYQIVAGEHRWRAAQIIDCEVPVLPLPPSQWVDDRQKWMLVKDNILTGKLNPVKFAQLYEEMAARYDAEVLQSLMGFTSSDAFQKVYKETRDALPPEMQKALDDSKAEIKTIDDLSTVLNRLFSEYGETLPSNVMVFTWGDRSRRRRMPAGGWSAGGS
jgi:ParB-like chromosome segregation protein Spo0J